MRWRRIIPGAAILALAVGAGLVLAAVVLYRSPASVKALIERALASRLGVTVTIGSLGYGLDPASLTAEDIQLSDGADRHGLDLRVSKLAAEFRLEGEFGDRTLWLSRLELTGVSVKAQERGNWGDAAPGAGPPSWWGRIASKALAALWFRHLRFGAVTVADADLTWEGGELQAGLDRVNAESSAVGIEIRGAARARWPGAAAAVEAPEFCATLSLSFSEGDGVYSGRLELPAVFFENPRESAALTRASARFRVQSGPQRIAVEEGHLESAALTLKTESTGPVSLESLRVNLAGSFGRQERVLTLSRWQLAAAGLVEGRGQARLNLTPPYALEVSGIEANLWPEHWVVPAAQAAGLAGLPMTLAGAVGISGGITLHDTGRGWDAEGRLNAAFRENRVAITAGPMRIAGLVSGSVKASGRAAAPQLEAALSGRQVEVAGTALKAGPFAFEASAEGGFPVFALPRIEARIPSVTLPVAERNYVLKDIVVRVENGNCDLDRVEVSLPTIFLSSDPIRNLEGALTGDRRQVAVTLAGRDIGLAGAAAGFGLLPSGWRLSAADRFKAQAVFRPEGESALSATLDLAQLGFGDADQSRAAENLALRAELKARSDLNRKNLAADLAVRLSGGELLWERFYLDLGRNPAAGSARVRYAAGEGQVWIDEGRLAIEGLAALNARGRVQGSGSAAGGDLSLVLPPTPIAPLFAQLVAEPLRFSQPELSGLRVAGEVSAELRLSGAGAQRTLKGHANWHSGSAALADGGIGAEEIDLRLPVWVQSGVGAGDPAPMGGGLTIGRIRLPALPAQEIALSLSARPNQLSAGAGLAVRFPSGKIRLGAIEGKDVFGPRPRVRTRLAVERVEIGPFLKDIWSRPVAAVVSGELEDLVFDGRDILSRGSLVTEVFGGRVVVSDPGVGAVLGPAPGLRADCRIEGIDLSKLTEGTAFGRIRGVLSGTVDRLEVVDGQPQGFTLTLETVRRRGVPQRINVAAVENIARIGGGQSPFVGLAGNFAAFFKEFSYAKIGIHAELENDVFKVNGTVLEDGVEYLVRRGGIPGVDVVNLNPANRISFKDMVKRIRRVTESESGPVVR